MIKLIIPMNYLHARPPIGSALFVCINRLAHHVCPYPNRASGQRYEGKILVQERTFNRVPNQRNAKSVALDFGVLNVQISEKNAHTSVPVSDFRVSKKYRQYIIYADGSTLNNGRGYPKGGYGVVCESDRSRDTSGWFTYGNQTNNRYELEAIKKATEIADVVNHWDFIIKTDSKYAIDAVTIWVNKWKQNGWMNTAGQPVQNRELIEDIGRNIRNLCAGGKNVVFEHVSEHHTKNYNNEADRLARSAVKNNTIYDEIDRGNFEFNNQRMDRASRDDSFKQHQAHYICHITIKRF